RMDPQPDTRSARVQQPGHILLYVASVEVVAGGSAYPIGGGRDVRPSVEVIKSAHFLVSEWLSAR
ncbi:MAG: hypothetical protein JWN47_2892, partial [Frankiales bacterium]|nr:hypothetical protein [Frankiales bacterium]